MHGDSENLPFDDDTFDAVTVAFGVRNFENLEKGLSEIYRVMRPGGKLVVLETSVPEKFPFRQGYYLYTKFLMPTIGKLFSKDKSAYSYLSESASSFPYGKKFKAILEHVGYQKTNYFPQTLGGVATIYVGNKKG
ncbi:Demethylmenaquinone methyltransferase (fragment) [Capnocytophaga canimorsus]